MNFGPLYKLGFSASVDFIAPKTLSLYSVSFIESLNSVLLKYCLAYAGVYFSTVLASILVCVTGVKERQRRGGVEKLIFRLLVYPPPPMVLMGANLPAL